MAIPVIIQGEDKTLAIRLTSGTTGDPYDLSTVTDIEARFANADGTCQHYDLSTGGVQILSALGGRFQVNLPASGTGLLALSDPNADVPYQGIEVHVSGGGLVSIINLPGTVDVKSRLFPNC
jgi:hypothetical protein